MVCLFTMTTKFVEINPQSTVRFENIPTVSLFSLGLTPMYPVVWHTRNCNRLNEAHVLLKLCLPGCCRGRPANMSECLRPPWEERLETSGEKSRGRSHWNRLDKYIAWRIILPITVCIFRGNPASHAITADTIFNYTHTHTHTQTHGVILDITSVPGRFYSTQHLSSKESPLHAQR